MLLFVYLVCFHERRSVPNQKKAGVFVLTNPPGVVTPGGRTFPSFFRLGSLPDSVTSCSPQGVLPRFRTLVETALRRGDSARIVLPNNAQVKEQ